MISDWMEQGSVVAFINSKSETVDRFDMSKQVVGAVAFLHQQNVVHGDLKGANILVARDCTLKIADFGLTIVHEGNFQFSATDPGGGTMRWMAPELFKEHAKRTPQTDIYALGMTLLEIFTGKEPFHEVSGHLIPILVTQERKVPMRPNYLLTSSEQNNIFWEILTKCWAFEPDKRAEAAELESLIKSVRM
ncbi:kinase-like protein [Ceratobasidium sp. AG-I]|nr:kinase-like protein [Ceratobasidium sp. AG-I]